MRLKIIFTVLMIFIGQSCLSASKCSKWDLVCKAKEAFNGATDAVKSAWDTASSATKSEFKDIKDDFSKWSDEARQRLDKAANVLQEESAKSGEWFKQQIQNAKNTENAIGDKFKKFGENVKTNAEAFANVAEKTETNWFANKLNPSYCKIGDINALHSLENPMDLSSQKDDGLKTVIMKYSPVLYLHKDEKRYPIWVSEFFTGPNTGINCGAEGRSPCMVNEKNPVVPKGQVTMEKIYNFYTDYKANKRAYNLYFDIDECVTYGSDPKLNKDSSGNLTTPVYVITYNDNAGHIYIQYLFTFAFNEPYDIGPFTGDSADFQNAHEFDLEHFTVELDANTKELKRLYYGSHGRYEGFWLNPHDPHVQYEGTHPIVYIARGGHGTYPRAGTYVRIFGVANDVTSKDVRWTPRLMRFFDENDPRFDVKSMAWVYHAGPMGRRGIDAVHKQSWFMNSTGKIDPQTGKAIPGGDIGRDEPESKAPFCPKTGDTLARLKCMAEQIPQAKPPK